jgi:hypothetical protein
MENPSKPSREELLILLDEIVNNMEKLPSQAMSTYVTHYDLWSSLLLVAQIFKSESAD